jgi:hypothetical protein
MATSGGHPGRSNEDFVGAGPDAIVLLDGAGIPGTESICAHGVAWFTRRLGGALLGRLAADDGTDLVGVLGDAIAEVADAHRAGCDIRHVNSPSATVAIVRVDGERLDHLLLADSYLLLDDRLHGVQALTDGREATVRSESFAPLADEMAGTPSYDRVLDACVQALRSRRNQPGGYWIAKDDPRAAEEAVTGSRPLRELESLSLLSNGASRIVTPYGRTDWPGVLHLLRTHGPAEVIRRVREAERTPGPDGGDPDDATVAFATELRSADPPTP